MKSLFLKITCLCLALALWACNDKSGEEGKVKLPDNILNEQRFAKVLADFALAESASNLNVKGVAGQRMDTVYAFDPLKENHIRRSQYDSSVLFYSQHTALYKKVYEAVLVNLSELQTHHDSIHRHDSLAKINSKKDLTRKDTIAK